MVNRIFIDGMSLRAWCILHQYPYQNATKYIRENPNFSVDDLKMYLDNIIPRERIFYKGKTLKQFCDEHDYNYQVICRKIRNIKIQSEREKIIDT